MGKNYTIFRSGWSVRFLKDRCGSLTAHPVKCHWKYTKRYEKPRKRHNTRCQKNTKQHKPPWQYKERLQSDMKQPLSDTKWPWRNTKLSQGNQIISDSASRSCLHRHSGQFGFVCRHWRRIKAVSSACERRQHSSASLLSCIGLINVSSPAPWDRPRRDTRLSQYWPIRSPSIDAVQPCSRLSVAPELVLYSQLLNQQTGGFVQLLLSRRKRKVTRLWHLRETKEKIQKVQHRLQTLLHDDGSTSLHCSEFRERSWKLLTKCHVKAALIDILLKRWMKCQRIMWKVSLAVMNP